MLFLQASARFVEIDRGYTACRLVEANVSTGGLRTVVEERDDISVNNFSGTLKRGSCQCTTSTIMLAGIGLPRPTADCSDVDIAAAAPCPAGQGATTQGSPLATTQRRMISYGSASSMQSPSGLGLLLRELSLPGRRLSLCVSVFCAGTDIITCISMTATGH